MNLWGWVVALHVLCAVVWVGGMFFAYVVLRPSLSALEPLQRIAIHTQVFRRFFLVIWHAMPLILIRGSRCCSASTVAPPMSVGIST